MKERAATFTSMASGLQALRRREPFLWLNPDYGRPPAESAAVGEADLLAAEARLARFAPLLCELFPETATAGGIIESALLELPALTEALHPGCRLLLKADHDLPVAGSVKARGGIYEVLGYAERLAFRHGLLEIGDNYRRLLAPAARRLFAGHAIVVGSTGNLGLSIGIIAAALGFRARVHMSAEAKDWKKEMLRQRGVEVVQHAGDYSAAVAQGRQEASQNPAVYFVDDENSRELFLGYAVAAFRLRAQLRERGAEPAPDEPLFVYLPCGVGGAPGGICFGLKQLFGAAVHCFFAEPVESPCMTLALLSRRHATASVYDLGLSNRTVADGLAVARPSAFVAAAVGTLVSGCYTVSDERMRQDQVLARQASGLNLEVSAVAGFSGPEMLLHTPAGHEYLRRQQLQPARIRHLLWTTGGRFLPPPSNVTDAMARTASDHDTPAPR